MVFGGLDGIPNLGLVESAIARPYCGYYRPFWKKAAVLVQSMAGNHGFADGNKRTTLIMLHLLITGSGYMIVPQDNEDIEQALENIILASVTRTVTLPRMMEWFRLRLRKETLEDFEDAALSDLL